MLNNRVRSCSCRHQAYLRLIVRSGMLRLPYIQPLLMCFKKPAAPTCSLQVGEGEQMLVAVRSQELAAQAVLVLLGQAPRSAAQQAQQPQHHHRVRTPPHLTLHMHSSEHGSSSCAV
jgi:hypothetical protein